MRERRGAGPEPARAVYRGICGTEAPPLDRSRVSSVSLTVPALHPTLSVPIRADHPLVARAARRAAHLCFDDGPAVDIYVATLTRAEAVELLHDPARRVNDAGEAELARRVVGEDDAALQFTVPCADGRAVVRETR